MNLYQKHRPKKLSQVIGQDGAIASVQSHLDRGNPPRAWLFTGPSGCGKTTIARILKKHLQCGDADFQEINAADIKGIEMVRDIRRSMNLAPIDGECRIWLIDEAHKLTGDAQGALLKMLEDTPGHVYFMLATTDPQKLIKAIHTRCNEVTLKSVSHALLAALVTRVAEEEEFTLSSEVVSEIAEAADGSARKALVILEAVGGLEPDDQLAAIQTTTFSKDAAIDLARHLVTNPRVTWPEVAKVLRGLKDEDAEGIRYCVLGYARACLVGSEERGPNLKLGPQAFKVIDIFSKNFYDSKQAGLAAACWEVLNH